MLIICCLCWYLVIFRCCLKVIVKERTLRNVVFSSCSDFVVKYWLLPSSPAVSLTEDALWSGCSSYYAVVLIDFTRQHHGHWQKVAMKNLPFVQGKITHLWHCSFSHMTHNYFSLHGPFLLALCTLAPTGAVKPAAMATLTPRRFRLVVTSSQRSAATVWTSLWMRQIHAWWTLSSW